MPRYLRRRSGVAALGLAVALVVSACGGNDGASAGGGEAEGLSGAIRVSGSSTVEPITSLVAEKFAESNPDVEISVDGPGTGDGFAAFCAGDIDIADASRPIDEEEVAACQQAGIEYIELQVGVDGLSVITSASNDQVSCLTFGDIYALVGPESEGFKNWSDANQLATEVGGKGNFPNAPLSITGPGEESGTYDSFVEIVLQDIAEERKVPEDQIATRPDYTASANDNVIIEGISGNDTSLGWVGYAFADQNKDKVKLLEVDDGESGCVAPTPETISSAEFPISRPLFIYVDKAKAEQDQALTAFVDFYLSEDGLASVEEADYVAMNDQAHQKTQDTWKNKTAGTQQGT